MVVAPKLLGDTLARALRDVGIEVVLVDEAHMEGPWDVAVVSGDISVAIDAPVVVTLPGDHDHGVGTIRRQGSAAQPVELPDVETLVRTVWLEGRGD